MNSQQVVNSSTNTPAVQAAMYEQPLTTKQVAAMLGPHPKTIERYARDGKIPGHFKMNHWYFFASELDKWMRLCESADSQFVSVN